MNPRDFTSPASGRLIQTIGGSAAFVPAPLPPVIDRGAIAFSLAEALQALGELKGACRRLPNPYILVRPLQRREALTSSAMEGTFTTDDQLLLLEAGVEGAGDESTQEVQNYLTALDESLKLLQELPISHRVLKAAHKHLLSGLSLARGAQKRPGEYKVEQNWIGGRVIEAARFVPPPPAETQTCMDELEQYLNRGEQTAPAILIDLALVHYQLETIHPFSDGNGRVGRMLISLMAVHSGLLDMPVLYMSPALERQKERYIDLMFNVSSKGEWTEWLNFLFDVAAESCRETISTIDRLLALQDGYKAKLVQGGIRAASATHLIDHLFERPAITVTDAASKLGVTYAAAKGTIDKLAALNILRPHATAYPKVFYAPEIMQAARPAVAES